MRFGSLRLQGIGPYRDEVFIDFDALPGPLVAICGANGAGKTCLLEALLAGLYRKTKTRGHMKALATLRDSFVEVGVVIGEAAYLVRQTCDAHTGGGEAVVLGPDGQPLTESGKSSEAKRWVTRHCPDLSVYLASLFGAQKVGGLLGMDPAPRMQVVGRALGNARYELLAKAAGNHAKTHQDEVAQLYARLDEIGTSALRVQQLTATFAEVTAALQQSEQHRADADRALVAGREEAGERQAALSAWRERKARRADVARRIATLEADAELNTTRLANNRRALERAPEIRAAHAKLEGLRDQKVEVDRDVTAISSAVATAEAEQTRLKRESASAQQRMNAAAERIARAQATAATAGEVEAAARELKKAEKRLGEAHKERERFEEELRQARELERTSQLQRISGLRSNMEAIASPAGVSSPGEFARLAIDADDRLIAAAQDAPQAIAQAEASEREIRTKVDAAGRELAELRITAARQRAIDEAKEDVVRATAEQLTAGEEMAAAETRLLELESELPELRDQQSEARKAQQELADQVEPLQKDARLFDRLGAAEARIAELEAVGERLAKELETAQTELEQLPVEPEPEPLDLRPLQQAYDGAVAEVEALQRDLARAEAQLKQAKETAEREAELRGHVQTASAELADWKLLHSSLGRDGIQALELDAAGPELTDLTNEFLRCAGGRFSVRLDTTRRGAKGQRIEEFTIMVYDAQNGREGEAKTFSPGEQAFIGEALDLALSLYGIRRLGSTRPTIIRDEPTSTLDPDNGRTYVEMLRRAAELTDAHRVLFVTHHRSLWPLADSRIHIADGRVTVD